jgi:hypothetical protein
MKLTVFWDVALKLSNINVGSFQRSLLVHSSGQVFSSALVVEVGISSETLVQYVYRTFHETVIYTGILYLVHRLTCVSYNLHFFLWFVSPGGPRLLFCRGFTITLRDATLGRTALDKWSARGWDHYLTTHSTHNRQIFTPPGGIRTRNPSKPAPSDPRLRPRGQRDRLPLRY